MIRKSRLFKLHQKTAHTFLSLMLPRRQRRQKLLGMLLQAREPMKTAALARELLVSESTLAADLDEIGQ